MKRFLLLILVVVICFTQLPCYAQNSEVSENFYVFKDDYFNEVKNKDIKTLIALGVMAENTDASALLIRGKAAEYVAALAGYGYQSISSVSSYKDVPSDHLYSKAIAVCEVLGIMKEEKYFRPNAYITVDEAAQIFMNLLGYKDIPNYKAQPVCVRLLSGIKKAGGALTEGDFASIACNALNENMLNETYRVNESSVEYYEGSYSLMERFAGAKRITGRVNAIGNAAFEGYECREDEVYIGGVVAKMNANIDITLLGREVEAYVTEYDGIFYLLGLITKNEAEYKRLHYSQLVSDSSSYTLLNVVAEENNKVKNFPIKPDARIIYNGYPVSVCTKEDICPKYGEMLLVDENSDGIYDVVTVWNFETKLIKYVHYFADAVFCYDETSYSSENTDMIIDCYRNGESCAINDLRMHDSIAVARSKNDEYCLIVGSSNKINGKVSQVSKDFVVINGKKYGVSKFGNEIKLGMSDDFYIDIYGNIASFANTGQDGMIYGYILDKTYGEMFEPAQVKIFCETGAMEVFDVADKVKMNNNTVNSTQLIDLLGLDQLIKIKVNSANEVKEVYTADKSNTNTGIGYNLNGFSLDYKGNTRFQDEPQNVVDCYYTGSEKTIIMHIPTYSDATDEDYFLMDTSFLLQGQSHDFEIYDSDEYYEPRIVLTKESQRIGRKITDWDIGREPVVVREVSRVIYNDRECYKISAFYNAINEDLYIYDDTTFSWNAVFEQVYGDRYKCPNNEDRFTAEDLNPGDIIRVTDYKGKVTEIMMMYRNDLTNPVTNTKYMEFIRSTSTYSPDKWLYSPFMCKGTIYYIGDSRIIIRTGDGLYRTMAFNLAGSSFKGVVYNSRTNEIDLAATADWHVGDQIVIYAVNGNLNAMVLIK